jgi:hypothetical protein
MLTEYLVCVWVSTIIVDKHWTLSVNTAVFLIFPYGSRLMGRSVYLGFTNQNHFKMHLPFHTVVRSLAHLLVPRSHIHSLVIWQLSDYAKLAIVQTSFLAHHLACEPWLPNYCYKVWNGFFKMKQHSHLLHNKKTNRCSCSFALINFHDYIYSFSYNNRTLTEEQKFTFCT